MRLRIGTTLVPLRRLRRFGELAPKLLALVLASAMSLLAALTTAETATEETERTKPSVVHRHFV